MKKLIGLLGSLGLVAAAGITVVSCGDKDKKDNTITLKILLSDLKINDSQTKKDVKDQIASKLMGATLDKDYSVTFNPKSSISKNLSDDDKLTNIKSITVKALQDFKVNEKQVKKDDSCDIDVTDANRIKDISKLHPKAIGGGKTALTEDEAKPQAIAAVIKAASTDDNLKKLAKEDLDTKEFKANTKDADGSITVFVKKASEDKFKGEVKVTITKFTKDKEDKEVKADDIKNNADVKKIKDLADLAAVNKALDDVAKKIDGVDTLVGKVDDKPTNVKVTIKLKTGYKLTGDDTFVIEGAIKAADKEVKADDIKNNADVKKIKDLADLAAVNKALDDIAKKIDGVDTLVGKVDDKPTNVKVTIKLKTGYKLKGDDTFVIEGAIKAADKEVKADDIKNNADVKKIKDLADLAAVNKALDDIAKKIEGVDTLVGKVDDKPTNVKVTIKLKTGYKLTGNDTFVIEGAIKAADKEVKADDIKNNADVKKIKDLADLAAVNKALDDVAKKIEGVDTLVGKVDDKPTNVKVTIKLKTGYKLTGDDTFVIEGAIKAADKEVKADDIKNNADVKKIKDLADLAAVNKALDDVAKKIEGVDTLVGKVDDKPTNVKVTIKLKTGYKLTGDDTFVIEGAIKAADKEVKADDIKNNADVKKIKDLADLAAVNKALDDIAKKIEGVDTLVGKVDDKPTNVKVTIKLKTGYKLTGADTFVIEGAIKAADKEVKADDIKNNADVKKIKDLADLAAVNKALDDVAKKIDGVDTLVGKVDDKPTNVKVTIKLKTGYKLTGNDTFVIEGAIKAKTL
ncbi:lipoprotein [Spiroplasma endosymbiont of Crioceris asparagi]|uniref:lipoprotein n=1 Tax=Spiroplasma endosymbiont of Crioceris asparagi TaxID=3066286 RepID=UPI0030D1A03F